MLATRETHVTNHNDEPATSDEYSRAFRPHRVQLLNEQVVVFEASKLTLAVGVALESPVRRGRKDQVHGLIRDVRQAPGIAQAETLLSRDFPDGFLDEPNRRRILGKFRNGRPRKRPTSQVRKVP
jgi:hypothetical protein